MGRQTKKNNGFGKTATIGVAVILIGIVIYYFYSAAQGQMRGFNFGNELQEIQDELKNEQSIFYSNVRMWEENGLTKTAFLELSKIHIKKMNDIISK